MKKVSFSVTLLALLFVASASFAAIGDTYHPHADFDWVDPSPWSYLCQEGTGHWDGTYNFTPMVVRTLITTGTPMWGAPNSEDFYGWQCGVYQYYGNLAVNSYHMLTDPSRVYGFGVLAFTAPEGGDYNLNGWVTGYAGNVGTAWINIPGQGQVWSGSIIGDYTQSWPTFNFTVNLAAGTTIYFGCDYTVGGVNVYGLWETFPLYWNFTITQTSDVVIPEPSALAALLTGLTGLAGAALVRKR